MMPVSLLSGGEWFGSGLLDGAAETAILEVQPFFVELAVLSADEGLFDVGS